MGALSNLSCQGHVQVKFYNKNILRKPDKKSFIYWKRKDSLNQFIPREDKLRKEGVKGYTSKLVVYKLEMADGSVLELLNQLPK